MLQYVLFAPLRTLHPHIPTSVYRALAIDIVAIHEPLLPGQYVLTPVLATLPVPLQIQRLSCLLMRRVRETMLDIHSLTFACIHPFGSRAGETCI